MSSDNSALSLEVRDDQIAILTIDQPDSRVNTLSRAMVSELESIVEQIQQKSDLQGLIFRSGKPGTFIVGADLKELGEADQSPEATRQLVGKGLQVIAAIEGLPFPTIALIDGPCMGGGLELAMAFDFRLASTHPKTTIGLPETKIGLIPGWGGTQRLPRIVGPSIGAEMICGGQPANAERAREIGLVFDAVPSEHLIDEAGRVLEWARESDSWKAEREKKQQPIGLTELQHGFTFAVAQAQVQAQTKGQFPAPLAALKAISQGCNLTLEDGLKVETDEFVKLVGSPISRNLIAIFFMNQRLSKDIGVQDRSIEPKQVSQVGVIGAGLMGAGIVGAHVRKSVPTMMLDVNAEALEKGVNAINKVMQIRLKIGRMTEEQIVHALGQLSTSTSLKSMSDRDVVIEAVVENEDVKLKVYQDLLQTISDDAILASNTSTISITRMGKQVKNPSRFAGMHYFNPVDRMQLVEVIRGEETSDQTVVTLVSLARRIGKTPIVVRDCPGFLVNRILFPYLNESLILLEEGVSPRELDKVATKFGMPMGPITLNDVVGLDTSLFAGEVIHKAFPDRAVKSGIIEDLVQAGRLGQKSGAGFYSYAKGSRGKDDQATEEILNKHRKETREHSQEEITERLFLPMLTEASRVLMEDIVREPADVDMGLILGIGFPAFRGGLLRWADEMGMETVLKKLEQYQSLGKRFEPTEQMKTLASQNKGFFG